MERGPRADRRSVRTGGHPERAGALYGLGRSKGSGGTGAPACRGPAGAGAGWILHADFLSERKEDPRELELFSRSLELAREAGDERLESWAEFWIGIVHQVVRDENERSLPYFQAAYDWARDNGETLLQSYAIRHLGFGWYEQGSRGEGRSALEESVRMRREDGFLPGVAAGLLTLGEIADEEGRLRRRAPAARRGEGGSRRVRRHRVRRPHRRGAYGSSCTVT